MSLFGHLAFQFAVSPENLATEALAFILRSPTARRALLTRIRGAGVDVADDLHFRTQAADGGAIPDMAGRTREGADVLLIEAKFWAGLTDDQPSTYLERLPTDRVSLLLFVAPAARQETLWPELRRLAQSDYEVGEEKRDVGGFKIASLGRGRHLGICSWRVLLRALRADLEAASEYRLVGEIDQLDGLCERMDAEAFQPIRSEDTAPAIPRRIIQYTDLVDDVVRRMVDARLANTKGLTSASAKGYYSRYFNLVGHGCALSVDYGAWASLAETPLWLRVKDEDWKYSERVWESLSPLLSHDPPRLFRHDGHAVVPMYLTPGVERHAVLADVVAQVTQIADLLRSAGVQPTRTE